ncbi:MAG: hypothetical protein HF981_07305 [Desulfobacteraceae bacterium]|nr:hypothetical protein [Desulfobacteraceae bacterium]MBC2750175.1 hypothetical protein [Desulfobacteraceae bacterium]
MGNIETTYDLPKDLTTFKVVGKMRIVDFYDCLEIYYEGGVTPLTLWDLTEADVSGISSDEISNFAQYSRNFAEARKGGKTAIVFNDSLDYGLGRMFATYLELADVPLEVHTSRNLDDAKKWLGIDEHMIAESMVYKIGSCIQKTETGELDRTRSIDLIHELSVAIKFHKDQHILVDLRDASVQTDIQDLMAFAAECAKFRSEFDKKIAILIPNTEERIEAAKRFRSCMDVQGFRLKQFFDYEPAIDWLSVEE